MPFIDYGSARDWYFDTGNLQLTAEDGSTLILTPASDVPENVSITVAQGDYSVTFQKPWSSWTSHLQIFPVLEEADFPTNVPASTPVIRMDNYATLITAALDVMTGTEYWSLMTAVPWRWEGDNFVTNPDDDGWSYSTKSCDNGGSASTQYTVWDGAFERGSAEYEECLFDSSQNVIYDGAVEFKGGLLWRSVRSDALMLTQSPDADLKMAGWLQESGSFTRDDGHALRRTDQLAILAVEADGAVLEVSNSTIYWGGGLGRSYLDFSADLAGYAIFRSPETDDRRVKVSTQLPFHYVSEPSAESTAWTFPVGRLQLLADDGSELILDAGASEAGRVQITLNNSVDDTQFDVGWGLWAEMLRP